MQEDKQTNNLQINIQSKNNKQLRRKQQTNIFLQKNKTQTKCQTGKQTNNKTIIQANTHQNS